MEELRKAIGELEAGQGEGEPEGREGGSGALSWGCVWTDCVGVDSPIWQACNVCESPQAGINPPLSPYFLCS